jgi:hypothetical protein
MFGFHRGNVCCDRLEVAERRFFIGGQFALGVEMGEQHEERVLDTAERLS